MTTDSITQNSLKQRFLLHYNNESIKKLINLLKKYRKKKKIIKLENSKTKKVKENIGNTGMLNHLL